MDIEDESRHVRLLIRDRDGKFPSLLDTVLADAGIQVVLSSVRIPRINAIMERWIRSCRHELLDLLDRDATGIWTSHLPCASTAGHT